MSKQPNIVFIMCDQLRGDALGFDGNEYIETPNLDYLAAHGTRFNHAYTACPSCIPARAILLTGMDQWHTGILGMGRGQSHMPSSDSCDARRKRRIEDHIPLSLPLHIGQGRKATGESLLE